jgi:tetratricopeptide (TPR) repeat protein
MRETSVSASFASRSQRDQQHHQGDAQTLGCLRSSPLIRRPAALLVATLSLAACRRTPPYELELARGEAALNSDPAQARAHFQRAVELGARVQGSVGIGLAEEALGHPDEALKHLQTAKLAAPSNVQIRLAWARVKLAKGDQAAARAELEAVVTDHPDETPALLLLSVLTESDARARRVLELWDRSEQIASKDPQPRPAEVMVARAELGSRLGRDPRPELDRVATGTIPLFHRETAGSMARALLQLRRADAARALLKAITARSAGDARSWLDLLRLETDLGQFAAAERTLRRVPSDIRRTADCLRAEARLASMQGRHAEAARILGRAVNAAPRADRRGRAMLLLSRAQAMILDGNETLALEVLTSAAKLDGDFLPAQLALAALRLKAGQTAEAANDLRRLVAKHPREAKAHELLISALLFLHDEPAARGACKAYLAALKPTASAHAFVAAGLSKLGDRDAARTAYLESLKLDPQNAQSLRGMADLELPRLGLAKTAAWLREQDARAGRGWQALLVLGDLMADQRQPQQAEATYREATSRDPKAAQPWARLGLLLERQAQYDRAIEALQKSVSLDPSPAMGLLERLAKLERDRGRHVEARATYEKILQRDPESLSALNNLAMLLAGPLGAPNDAVGLAERAQSKALDSPAIADTLGWALVRRGKKEDAARAVELLTTAANKLKTADVYYHLGKAYALAGKPAEARSAFDRALALSSKFAGSDDARAMLGAPTPNPPGP